MNSHSKMEATKMGLLLFGSEKEQMTKITLKNSQRFLKLGNA